MPSRSVRVKNSSHSWSGRPTSTNRDAQRVDLQHRLEDVEQHHARRGLRLGPARASDPGSSRRSILARAGRKRSEAPNGPQDAPDAQRPQRGERVAGVAGQPGRAAQAHRVGAGPEVLAAVVDGADPTGGDDRQRHSGLAQLGDHAQPDRLDRPPGQPAVAVGQPRRAGARVQPQRLHRVDRGQRGHPGRRPPAAALAQVVVVRRQLEDHRMVAAGHGLVEHVGQDRREVEVDVVAGHVELDRGDVARRHRRVHPVDERDELRGREPAQRDDHPLVPGARVVVAQVGVDADVAPAERVEPAAVGAAQDRAVAPQQAGELAQRRSRRGC